MVQPGERYALAIRKAGGVRQRVSEDLEPLSGAALDRVRSGVRNRKSRLSRAHADALDGLEQFALGLDARRDDDLGFLKLPDARGPNISHARRDRADQVLGTVIDCRGPEKNLF